MTRKLIHLLLKNKLFTHLFFTIVTAATLALTLLPSENLGPNELFQYDKIGHFSLFFAWTLGFGLVLISRNPEKAKILIIIVVGAFFGLLIEFSQYLLPTGRYFEVYDALANILGSICAGMVIHYLKKKYQKITRSAF